MTKDLTVEQYHMVCPEWYRSALNQPRGKYPVSFIPSLRGRNELHLKYAYHHSCLVCDYTILFTLYHSAHQLITVQEHIHHIKPCLGRLETSIRPIALHIKHILWLPATEVQNAPLDRDINLDIEEGTGIDNDNDSTHGLATTVALGGQEAEGHPNDPIYSNQDKLTTLTREINDLHQ